MSLMRVWPSGNLIDPLNPDPQHIEIWDIAYHLAGINRYGGASRLTVAQHCCEMALYALGEFHGRIDEGQRLFAYECLMHDSAEYLLGDLIRPIKNDTALGHIYRPIEEHVQGIIRTRFGVTNRYSVGVTDLDRHMCATEQRDLHAAANVNALPITIHPWSAQYAEQKFIRLFFLLKPEIVSVKNVSLKEVE